MRSKSRRNRKSFKRNKKNRKSVKRKYNGGFSELGFFFQKGLGVFDITPSVPYGNPGMVAPFPYFQSK